LGLGGANQSLAIYAIRRTKQTALMCVVIRDDRAGSIGKGWTNNRLHAYFHCTVYTVQPVVCTLYIVLYREVTVALVLHFE